MSLKLFDDERVKEWLRETFEPSTSRKLRESSDTEAERPWVTCAHNSKTVRAYVRVRLGIATIAVEAVRYVWFIEMAYRHDRQRREDSGARSKYAAARLRNTEKYRAFHAALPIFVPQQVSTYLWSFHHIPSLPRLPSFLLLILIAEDIINSVQFILNDNKKFQS